MSEVNLDCIFLFDTPILSEKYNILITEPSLPTEKSKKQRSRSNARASNATHKSIYHNFHFNNNVVLALIYFFYIYI